MKYIRTTLTEIITMIQKNIEDNKITLDSFWEQHIIESNHYFIQDDSEIVGYFSIHNSHTLTSFYLKESRLQYGKNVFEKIKRFEQVTNAMVATGDEIFLSHCLDNYARLEKQAFLSIYRKETPDEFQRIPLKFKRITTHDELKLLKQAEDFFEGEPIDKLFDKGFHYRIYVVYDQCELIGFGIVETGRILSETASIGMYVVEEKRQKGYGRNILRQINEIMTKEGYNCKSGCWYYNHNSLKSMESAGAYSKTRLLKFYF
ncbi:MAG: N-acetyltransferase [Bacillota bacterium]|nr:N-acetyltransferase [Bacillota bacterium]